MGHTHELKKFRTNPIELAIFSVVTIICVKSMISLFYDQRDFHAAALTPMAASPLSEKRSLASKGAATTFPTLEFGCEASADQLTQAPKARISGTICGLDGHTFSKAKVTNTTNQFQATVFADLEKGKFTTDYIDLQIGKNTLRFEFAYEDGKVVTQDVTIQKN